jgi:hypothetical protein
MEKLPTPDTRHLYRQLCLGCVPNRQPLTANTLRMNQEEAAAMISITEGANRTYRLVRPDGTA